MARQYYPDVLDSLHGAAILMRANVWPVGALAGHLEGGAAVYVGHGNTPIVRPSGDRPAGVKPLGPRRLA